MIATRGSISHVASIFTNFTPLVPAVFGATLNIDPSVYTKLIQRLRGMTGRMVDKWYVVLSHTAYKSYQWPFQDPKLEVPTIYKAYIRPM